MDYLVYLIIVVLVTVLSLFGSGLRKHGSLKRLTKVKDSKGTVHYLKPNNRKETIKEIINGQKKTKADDVVVFCGNRLAITDEYLERANTRLMQNLFRELDKDKIKQAELPNVCSKRIRVSRELVGACDGSY